MTEETFNLRWDDLTYEMKVKVKTNQAKTLFREAFQEAAKSIKPSTERDALLYLLEAFMRFLEKVMANQFREVIYTAREGEDDG